MGFDMKTISGTPSLLARLAKPGIRLVLGGALRARNTAARRRALGFVAKLTQVALPRSVQFNACTLGGVDCEEVLPQRPAHGTLLYCHGGGYTVGTPAIYRGLTAQLAAHTGRRVLVPDYRLAPEHPFPAAPQDVFAVYRALLAEGAQDVVVAGDSAGGGLALAVAQQARSAGLPMPAALVLFSPFTDMHFSGESHHRCEKTELVLNRPFMEQSRAAYAADWNDPLAAARHADLRGFPPMLIQATEAEFLYSDSSALAAAAKAAGVTVQAENWPGLWHVWQILAGPLPDANRALRAVTDFLHAQGLHKA